MDIKTQSFIKNLDNDKSNIKPVQFNEINNKIVEAKEKKIDIKDANKLNQTLANSFEFSSVLNFPDNNQPINDERIFPGGINKISPSDINQGDIGDCYFLSALASMAQQRPADIAKMIKDNGDGTCTIKFPKMDGIKVDIPTNKQIATEKGVNKGENGSIWVSILERAYVKSHKYGEFQVEKSGFMLGKGISDITGHGTDLDTLTLTSNKTIRNKIEEKLKDKKLIVASTFADGDKDKNIISSHVYSILGYNRETDMVTIRNPWGKEGEPKGLDKNDGIADGVFQLSIEDFNSYFSFISYEN